MNTRSFFLSAIISGVVIGILGNIPVANLINCILCVWVWLGGILAVYLYQRYQHGVQDLSVGQAAGLGAVSGFIGALVGFPINLLTGPIMGSIFNSMARAFQTGGNMPFPANDFGSTLIFASTSLFFDAILYTIFGAIGAIIAVNLFWKKPQATPTITS